MSAWLDDLARLRTGRRGLLRAAGLSAAALPGLAALGNAGAMMPAGSAPSHLPASATGPATRLPALMRGVNLTHWFEYEQSQRVPQAELRALRDAGFDHVRIPVDPVVGGWRPEGVRAAPAYTAALRSAVETAIGVGLEVVFDLHLTPASKQRIEDNPALGSALPAFWADTARALADLPVARLAFELYNEPQYYGWRSGRWPAVQQRMLAALREQAPRHLVLLSGHAGGSLKGLRDLPLPKASADPALAYVFHYYEPFLFTHQGAHWLDPRYTTAGLRSDLRYPAAAQGAVRPGLSRPHPKAEQDLADYQRQDGSPARVRADIDAAGSFARAAGIRLVCNEFGAIRAQVDPASRYRWLADVRSALESQRIGWAVWDYSDIFGITKPRPGHTDGAAPGSAPAHGGSLRMLEPAALQALGLVGAGVGR